MAKRMILMLIGVGILFGIVAGWYQFRQAKIHEFLKSFASPAITISTTEATSETWTPYIAATGSITAIQGVDVSPQADGVITDIFFKSGTIVKKGDPLIQIDDRLEQATLEDYMAQEHLAQLNYNRSVKLLQKGAESESTVDTDKANLQEAKANVEATKVQINYKHVTAPFSGKLGIRQVDLGQYISPGATVVSLQMLDPLYVQFTLPEKNAKDLFDGQTVQVTTDAYPDKTYEGKINAISSSVDESTRSITIQGEIANTELKLLPGMFAHVNVMLPVQEDVVTVPQTAISYNLYGNTVFVVRPDNKDKDDKGKPKLKAYRTYVEVGQRRSGVVQITKGIKAGDMVVTSGQLKLNNGDVVNINNSVEP